MREPRESSTPRQSFKREKFLIENALLIYATFSRDIGILSRAKLQSKSPEFSPFMSEKSTRPVSLARKLHLPRENNGLIEDS